MTAGFFRVALAAAVVSGGLACATAPATMDASRDLVYVTSQAEASATVLDARNGAVVTKIDFAGLGYGANARPHHVAADPDGNHWYVSLIGAGRVVRIDQYHRVIDEAPFEAAGMLTVDPGSDWLYVGRSMAAVDPPQRIGMVRRSTMGISEVDVFFARPHAIAVVPQARQVYTASLVENRMAMAPVGSEDVDIFQFDGPLHTIVQFAVSPDGRYLVGGGQMSGDLLVWEVTDDAPRRVATVNVGGQPWHPTFTPDGGEIWIPNLTANSVTVVETSGWTVAATLTHPALVEPHGTAVSPDGRTMFVTARNTSGAYGQGAPGMVLAFDVTSRRVRWVAEVGAYAAGVATRRTARAGSR